MVCYRGSYYHISHLLKKVAGQGEVKAATRQVRFFSAYNAQLLLRHEDTERLMVAERCPESIRDLDVIAVWRPGVVHKKTHELQSPGNPVFVAVLGLYEQKLKDTTEVLQSKVKVIGMLQSEIGAKEKELLEKGTRIKTTEEKLAMTSEQMMLMQENFVTMETTWREEKAALKDMVAAMETEKTQQIQQVSAALKQYETAYNQVAAQYQALQQQYAQVGRLL